jgi:hypothetical protein
MKLFKRSRLLSDIKLLSKSVIALIITLSFSHQTSADSIDYIVDRYNYVVSTQNAADSRYKFTNDNTALEIAKRIVEMGSNVIKLPWDSTGCSLVSSADFDSILKLPFYYYYLWFRTPYGKNNPQSYFSNPPLDYWHRDTEITEQELKMERDSTYAFTKMLLTKCNNTGKKFYLGNWEGDWLMLKNWQMVDATPAMINTMTKWLNARQAGCDSAKKEVPHTNVEVYCYAEVNQVKIAKEGKKMLTNAVLPNTNIDYVSYSSYDVLNDGAAAIQDMVKYINQYLKPKAGITGNRVFFLEFSKRAMDQNYKSLDHEKVNRQILLDVLSTGTQAALFWEMYNNEPQCDKPDGQHLGYWLIDNYNVKWPMFYTLKSVNKAARVMVRDSVVKYGKAPTASAYNTWLINYLKNIKPVVIWPDTLYKFSTILSNKASVLTVKDSSVNNNATTEQKLFIKNADNQLWYVTQEPAGSGYFRLKAHHSGKSLTASSSGTTVTQADSVNSDNQRWKFDYNYLGGGYFTITNKGTSKVLEVAGSSTTDGAAIQLGTSGNGKNQQWYYDAYAKENTVPVRQFSNNKATPFKCEYVNGMLSFSSLQKDLSVKEIVLYSGSGRFCKTLYKGNTSTSNRIFQWSNKELGLTKGIYFLSVKSNNSADIQTKFIVY